MRGMPLPIRCRVGRVSCVRGRPRVCVGLALRRLARPLPSVSAPPPCRARLVSGRRVGCLAASALRCSPAAPGQRARWSLGGWAVRLPLLCPGCWAWWRAARFDPGPQLLR